MRLGIIGLPQCGKNTVFDALTRSDCHDISKGEERIATIRVPDERVDRLRAMYSPKKTIHAQVEYFLPGAPGHGCDKAEQSPWRQARDSDALIHIVRNFKAYGSESPTPQADFSKLDQELILSDQVIVEKRLERMQMEKRKNQKFNPEEYALLSTALECLEAEKPLRRVEHLATSPLLRGYAFMSAKPVLVILNNDDENTHLPSADDLTTAEECKVVRAKLEQELAQMTDAEVSEFLNEFNISVPATDRVIRASYALMGLASFFTVGEDEVRAWTIKDGIEATSAAGVIHTDIQKGFIRAEVVSYDDLMAAGSYAEARKRGTVRLEGKTYPVQDGDIINFRFNV